MTESNSDCLVHPKDVSYTVVDDPKYPWVKHKFPPDVKPTHSLNAQCNCLITIDYGEENKGTLYYVHH